jgi:hypothetical protein
MPSSVFLYPKHLFPSQTPVLSPLLCDHQTRAHIWKIFNLIAKGPKGEGGPRLNDMWVSCTVKIWNRLHARTLQPYGTNALYSLEARREILRNELHEFWFTFSKHQMAAKDGLTVTGDSPYQHIQRLEQKVQLLTSRCSRLEPVDRRTNDPLKRVSPFDTLRQRMNPCVGETWLRTLLSMHSTGDLHIKEEVTRNLEELIQCGASRGPPLLSAHQFFTEILRRLTVSRDRWIHQYWL